MTQEKKREAFASLASRFKKKSLKKEIRPPCVKEETLFHKYCPDCEDTPCVSICEEEIIKIGDDKTPHLNFKNSGCTFCEECAKACPTGVLSLDSDKKIEAKFSINVHSCLAWNSVMCSSCKDICYDDAIEFFGVFRPTIDEYKCSSCGFCYNVCPPYAIQIS
jgi:ferredoxin-type protein NapF